MATEVLQELNLAQGALGENLFAEDIGHLFDGDAFVGLVVDSGTRTEERVRRLAGERGDAASSEGRKTRVGAQSLPDDAVGALAKLLGDGVSLVDDEVLVEDLEDLASL